MLSYSTVPEVPDPTPTLRVSTDAMGISALRQLVEVLEEIAHPCIISIENARFTNDLGEVTLASVEGGSLEALEDIEALVKACASAAAAIAHVHTHEVALHEIGTNSFVV